MNYAELKDFKPGTRLAFSDDSATTSNGEEGLATGVVNGPAMTNEAEEITHIPVFAKRDNGREATTIYVAVSNIVGEVET